VASTAATAERATAVPVGARFDANGGFSV